MLMKIGIEGPEITIGHDRRLEEEKNLVDYYYCYEEAWFPP